MTMRIPTLAAFVLLAFAVPAFGALPAYAGDDASAAAAQEAPTVSVQVPDKQDYSDTQLQDSAQNADNTDTPDAEDDTAKAEEGWKASAAPALDKTPAMP